MNALLTKVSQKQRAIAGSRLALTAPAVLMAGALYLSIALNDPLWRQVLDALPAGSIWVSGGLIASLALILLAGTYTLLAMVAPARLLKPVVLLMMLVATLCHYFMRRYGAVIDTQMLVNVVETHRGEVRELLSPTLLAEVVIYVGLPALALTRIDLKPMSLRRASTTRVLYGVALWGLAVAVALVQYKEVSLWLRAHAELREYPNPVVPVVSAVRLLADQLADGHPSLISIAEDAEPRAASASSRRRVVVMIVGETARADHFGINGYGRDTTPRLSARGDVVAFSDMQSCGTSTAVSVPCMFALEDRRHFDRNQARHTENVLDVLQRVGVTVQWRENNSGCQGVCNRIPTQRFSAESHPSQCFDGECHDEVLLSDLRAQLQHGTGDQLIVLHQLGSHGPAYFRRYPERFQHFTPECAQDDAYRCDTTALVNSYDNTIRYTDHVIDRTIELLSRLQPEADVGLLYVSDHGESLGEGGLYLHGFPYALAPASQTRVPLIAWLSSGLKRQLSLGGDCLRRSAASPHSHDEIFSTLLGLFDVRTTAYRPRDDLFGDCRIHA
ncbi:phosphoethanolamine--lipid A transferase [Flagellatimonas centrodinii]|uniref:phosphoethanolamine transferase n=1 Tax=Flagellatimonas centrodinii TaxID=2806210 RepID=UPI001FEDD24F|nr:phosphoethanolamine--lipid A transferase [Flagellatimonas centrodinii]ULQ47251.1 phosphoethanolamine--lipid A transferase [Flagellatimonas centrodinii]